MNEITAAAFITHLDRAVEHMEITSQDRKIFLKDMSEILDAISYSGDVTNNISLRSFNVHLELKASGYIRKYFGGTISSEEWHENDGLDRPHREGDKPAAIHYYSNGTVSFERWAENGIVTRSGDKPAVIEYHTNGRICSARWGQNNGTHRNGDKPAIVAYYESGKILAEEWWVNNQGYRESGKPKVIYYNEDNSIRHTLI